MKLFLDSANIESIKQWAYLLDGVTTNPTHLSKEGQDPTKQVLKICDLMHNKDVSVEVTEKDPKTVYSQAKKIAALGSNIVVKIPCHRDYYPLIAKLVHEKIKINITLVFTLPQAWLMCKMGVRYISPFVGRLDDNDVDGAKLLYELREMVDSYGYETYILAASLRHVRHVHEAINAGADVATMPPQLLEKISEHILTEKGMELFEADWKKLGVSSFPQ
jgi:transaldolase